MTPQSPLGYRQCCSRSIDISAKLVLSRTNKIFMYKADFLVIFTEKNKDWAFGCQISLVFTNANLS